MTMLRFNADDMFTRLVEAREHDPFALLGPHRMGAEWRVRILAPHAARVWLCAGAGALPMKRVHPAGVFEWRGQESPGRSYLLRFDSGAHVWEGHDPYAFPPELPADELYLFGEGTLHQAYRLFGAHCEAVAGVAGVRFRVWAPNAERVSVVGEFNGWDGRLHQMANLGASGAWELFLPDIGPGTLYKFEIRNRGSGIVLLKADPYAREAELRPGTASRVRAPCAYAWRDGSWLESRGAWDWQHAPISIYEVHAGSWMRHADGRYYSYRDLAQRLIPYVIELGFTHIEFMPLTEHPLDESWGYQTTGYFAPTSRFGTPDELRALVDACHAAGLGVILDWVPGHFPEDGFALAHFDGSALYEHEDPRLGQHPDWGTHVFNFGRNEVKSFLLSSAHYWLAEFHFDALRVDAVASMIYLDYSRKAGEWLPNRMGGRENLESIEFLRELNVMVHGDFPGALTIAEESTAWPMVSRPTYVGGLGFSMKWNMGWMNDTLAYMRKDALYRRFHHELLTFGQLYAYSENFLLPLSHDEVVHGKGSLLGKMPGDLWQRFANVRLLFTAQMSSPGKKLAFMGNEFAQQTEWHAGRELDWASLSEPLHSGVKRLQADLNRLYRDVPALHELDFAQEGFEWLACDDAARSVVSFVRRASDGRFVVVVLNFTPVLRQAYLIGVPFPGSYRELFNSDSHHYGGSDVGNGTLVSGDPYRGHPASLSLTLPPLAGIVLAVV